MFFELPKVLKGNQPPTKIAEMFQHRRNVQRGLLSSHGEASSYFVTFLDNHDMHSRFYFSDPGEPHRFDDQLTMAIGCLYCLTGIPCLYYGTEQGLHGRGDIDLAVREAFWGQPGNILIENTLFIRPSRKSRRFVPDNLRSVTVGSSFARSLAIVSASTSRVLTVVCWPSHGS